VTRRTAFSVALALAAGLTAAGCGEPKATAPPTATPESEREALERAKAAARKETEFRRKVGARQSDSD
jgi:hypothetical protein